MLYLIPLAAAAVLSAHPEISKRLATGITYVGTGYRRIAAALSNTRKPGGTAQSPTVTRANGKAPILHPAGSAFTATPQPISGPPLP